MQLKRQQKGFTLVEIAVVLVIIGLLLGGVLKGQELISSARVRNMADQQAGIQAAYYGFNDRYRAVPGDMTSDAATEAIGQTINLGATSSDGALSAPGTDWSELNGVWEQMSKAGFIQGSYPGTTAGGVDPSGNPPNAEHAPINVFNGVLILARDDGYQAEGTGTKANRLVLYMGRNTPVDIARELDVKVDDGRPLTGTLRNAVNGSNEWESVDGGVSCVADSGNTNEWDISEDGQNCNPAFVF
jgi:prepilin-type N-terminal cleavage/methylation domain-containing protein